ncbi:hypothetical protein EVAR_36755_1 [Eumeta japonica]|uniref:Uncharacterized protein n=1 Tax=Eumeta variegata TaxID=151549 RepID=A0A4C1X462_EUMVA|nr:hypothetical protein EVAR_36755_1 [Eumeta japonica]
MRSPCGSSGRTRRSALVSGRRLANFQGILKISTSRKLRDAPVISNKTTRSPHTPRIKRRVPDGLKQSRDRLFHKHKNDSSSKDGSPDRYVKLPALAASTREMCRGQI